jgi:hypothetical protein
MLRPLVVKTDTDLKSIAAMVLDGRFKGAQADAVAAQLEAVNSHVDPRKIKAGTVILVPDTPGFKATAASSVQSEPFGDFSRMVSDALGAAAERMRSGSAARAAERSDLAAAVKSAAFKRLVANDPDVQKQAEAALSAAEQEAAGDKQVEETLAVVRKAALAALGQLGKVVG